MDDDREIRLERMTWPDVERALEDGYATAVFACGAVEQHGPHLPLFMDAEFGSALALGVARRLGMALVAPTVRVGCSEHHMAFPGTLSLSTDTFKAVVRDHVTSLARHGFRRICIIPSHGGNFAPLAEALSELGDAALRAVGESHRVEVEAFTDLKGLVAIFREAAETEAGLGDRVGGHADIAEASIMLVLHPELVRRDRAEAGYLGPLDDALLQRVFGEGLRSVATNGILGDARGMSEAIGRRCIDLVADRLAAFFREA